jgi:hypothetical protein
MQITGIMTSMDPKRIEAARAKVKTRGPNWEKFGMLPCAVGRSSNARCGGADVRVRTECDHPRLIPMPALVDALLDKRHVLLQTEEVGLIPDPVDAADTVLGGATTGSAWSLCAFAFKDSSDACTFLARDDPPLCLADGLLERCVDDLEDVADGHAVWVLGDCDPGVEFGYEAETGDGWVHCGLVELRVGGVGVASEVHLGFSWAEAHVPDDAGRVGVKHRADEGMRLGIKVDG